jgi:ubiquinone/menaquinone biosynthesis C-methylase UbiE
MVKVFVIIFFNRQFLKNRYKLLNEMIKNANLEGDEIILDLGTGAGFLAIGFAKYLKNVKSIGLDKYSIKKDNLKTRIVNTIKINFVGNSLKSAKKNAKIENVEKKCEFIEVDATEPLNFSNNYFNIIVTSQFIYCIQKSKRIKIYKEINRVLKKGGKIIFFESKSFMGWDINEVKTYFENIGYKIKINPVKEFKKSCILVGKK